MHPKRLSPCDPPGRAGARSAGRPAGWRNPEAHSFPAAETEETRFPAADEILIEIAAVLAGSLAVAVAGNLLAIALGP
jgi:hypothetical protein